MKRHTTQRHERAIRPNVFNPVFDKNRRRVRGLWVRNRVYYAQVRVSGQVKQVPLHDATTVPQAVRRRQVLKSQVEKGEYPPPQESMPETMFLDLVGGTAPSESPSSMKPPSDADVFTDETTDTSSLPADQVPEPRKTIPAAMERYRADRDLLRKGDISTRRRENSGLNAWLSFCIHLTEEDRARQKNAARGQPRREACPKLAQTPPFHISKLDSKMLKEFAKWRRKRALAKLEAELEEGETLDDEEHGIAGRTLDLDVMAIQKVAAWAVTENWLPATPQLEWKTLATEPETIRLMTPEELDSLARANLVTEDVLDATPKKFRHLRARNARSAQAFRDYIYLIWYSGGREHETLCQRWSNATWNRVATKDHHGWKAGDTIRGHLHFPGVEAKAGGGHSAEDRNVDFHDKLERHLRDMYERRDATKDWMFPSIFDPRVPQGSFRTQLNRARELAGQPDVGFHHGRHYFISHAVMAGVDFRTIAYWVSHRDGGKLIGRKYSHLSPGHSKLSAQRLDSAF